MKLLKTFAMKLHHPRHQFLMLSIIHLHYYFPPFVNEPRLSRLNVTDTSSATSPYNIYFTIYHSPSRTKRYAEHKTDFQIFIQRSKPGYCIGWKNILAPHISFFLQTVTEQNNCLNLFARKRSYRLFRIVGWVGVLEVIQKRSYEAYEVNWFH